MNKGDKVLVRHLRKEGEITKIFESGDFLVAVGSLSVRCKEEDLSPPIPRKKKSHKDESQGSVKIIHSAQKGSRSLDLHGLSREEAEIRILEGINSAVLSGSDMIEIIHGFGSGALRSLVWEVLPRIPSVASFKETEGNPGSVTAFLK